MLERDAGENRPARSLAPNRQRGTEAAVDIDRTTLDALAVQVERLREEVHWMAKELDALLVWERSCPTCGRGVRRESLGEVARCGCGWVWE